MPPTTAVLNGKQCCALDLPCCIPPPGMTREETQQATFTEFFCKAGPCDEATASNLAAALLANVGIVPHGVDKAIVAGYAKFLKPAA